MTPPSQSTAEQPSGGSFHVSRGPDSPRRGSLPELGRVPPVSGQRANEVPLEHFTRVAILLREDSPVTQTTHLHEGSCSEDVTLPARGRFLT